MKHEFDSCCMHVIKQVVHAQAQNRTANENNRCTARFECRAAALHGSNAELLSSQQTVQGCYGFAPPEYKGVVFEHMCLAIPFGSECNRLVTV